MANFAEVFVDRLYEHGVRYAFGIPGGPWIPFMEAMRRREMPFILVANEASAGFMADVCYRLTGTPALCHGTFGPGATNLATGVGCAYLDRSALIAATTEQSDAMRHRVTQMNVDHQALFAPITKWTTRADADTLTSTIDQAMATSCEEVPGPVHIGLPVDLNDRRTPPGERLPDASPAMPPPSAEAIQTTADLIKQARRPLIAVGLTAARLGLGLSLTKLLEAIPAPVVLTPMAKGLLPETHPSYAGVLFHACSDRLADITHQADLVIGIGYDPVEFDYEAWLPPVPVLHIDTTAVELSAPYELAALCVGDLDVALQTLSAMTPLATEWDFDQLTLHRDGLTKALHPPSDGFGPSEALDILRDILPLDGILTCDVGAHTHLIGQLWPTPAPGHLLMTNGWSSMGFGIPAALAASLCRPATPVVCVTGDGGFTMMAGELITARRLGLNTVIVILADRMLSLIEVKQGWKDCPADSSRLFQNAFLDADRIFGVPVLKANSPATLRQALRQAFDTAGPVVVEAEVDGRDYHQLIARNYK
jgi:acetolactate synthase I/II/III large subunit